VSNVTDFIEHLSEKPWSMYKASDYSVEQWHNACLIHQHEGPPTSKGECKLPIKTPNGAVNKNGVYAAAAALGGARGGVNATPEQKASAAKALIRYYREMDKEPPPSLLKHSDFNHFLSHVGKKGMKWGVRRGSKTPIKTSSEHKKVTEIKKKRTPQLTNKQIKTANERMNLEQNFNRMNPSAKRRGQMKVKSILTTIGVGGGLIGLYNTVNSPAGKASVELGKKVLAKQAAKKAAKIALKKAPKQLTLF
jgi:hypothetical protein